MKVNDQLTRGYGPNDCAASPFYFSSQDLKDLISRLAHDRG